MTWTFSVIKHGTRWQGREVSPTQVRQPPAPCVHVVEEEANYHKAKAQAIADHLARCVGKAMVLRISRGYCQTCRTVSTIVLQEDSRREPLTCPHGHPVVIGVPGFDLIDDEEESHAV